MTEVEQFLCIDMESSDYSENGEEGMSQEMCRSLNHYL